MSGEMWALVVVGGVLALATLVGAVLLAVRVVRTRRLLGTLGVGGRVAFYGALIYTVLPVDVLPDPIYLDDMGVLAGALFYLTRLVHRRRTADRRMPGQPDTALPGRSGVPPGPGQARRTVS
ncbi:YkvA family protein [Micromonospora rifamycinica]|uniref:YkvA family protein n=1 Tax=Micromonospora rifamycinica TaxID=291594 RepID=UPI002E284498|nr:YkvA family protein [Micromonospora rifamycinica]